MPLSLVGIFLLDSLIQQESCIGIIKHEENHYDYQRENGFKLAYKPADPTTNEEKQVLYDLRQRQVHVLKCSVCASRATKIENKYFNYTNLHHNFLYLCRKLGNVLEEMLSNSTEKARP